MFLSGALSRKSQRIDRPHLHILGEFRFGLFFGFPVEDQVEDLLIRMGRGDHLEGGGLAGSGPCVDQEDSPVDIEYGLLFLSGFHGSLIIPIASDELRGYSSMPFQST